MSVVILKWDDGIWFLKGKEYAMPEIYTGNFFNDSQNAY